MIDMAQAIKSVGRVVRRLPLVSPKNPHKCDEQSIPKNTMPPKTPFWLEVKFKSHSETGRTYVIAQASVATACKVTPQRPIMT